MTSASAISSAARSVSRPGSPGPAPTRWTRPVMAGPRRLAEARRSRETRASYRRRRLRLRPRQEVGGPGREQALRKRVRSVRLVDQPLRPVREASERAYDAAGRVHADRRVAGGVQPRDDGPLRLERGEGAGIADRVEPPAGVRLDSEAALPRRGHEHLAL